MRLRRYSRRLRLLGVAALTLTLSGCGLLGGDYCVFHCGQNTRASTPLVQFLYGDDKNVPKHDATVMLNLPIRVGLAFLPPRSGNPKDGPTAAQRERILGTIRTNFDDLPYVSEIVPLPSYYFDYTRNDGMQQLEQLARLQRLDLMALVSYDQHSSTNENRRALTYLTIVGGMIFEGTHNETKTVIDLAVIEPTGKSLVLRAGGISSGSNSTTAIEQSHALAKQQRVGFDQATEQLIANFRTELADFENRVRTGTADIKVVGQPRAGGGGGGGGSMDPALMLFLSALALRTMLVWRKPPGPRAGVQMIARHLMIVLVAVSLGGCAVLRDPDRDRAPETSRSCSVSPDSLLGEGKNTFADGSARNFDGQLRIGLIFLPSADNASRSVPTATQVRETAQAVRERMLVMPNVSEVVIVPSYFIRHGGSRSFSRIQELAQRFDFDLVGLLSCSQFTARFRNLDYSAVNAIYSSFHAPWWVAPVFNDDFWMGDVDQAETMLAFTLIAPDTPSVVTFSTGLSRYGDTTTLVDDWRSSDFVRREGFERARNDLLINLDAALAPLELQARKPRRATAIRASP